MLSVNLPAKVKLSPRYHRLSVYMSCLYPAFDLGLPCLYPALYKRQDIGRI